MNQPVEQYVTALVAAWNSHDLERAAAMCALDYRGMDVAEARPQNGPDGARETMARYLRAFPDLAISPVEVVADGSGVAVRWVASGTHLGRLLNIPPTGRKAKVSGALFLRIDSGKIRQATSVWDVAGLLRCIGLLPELQ